MTINSLAFSKTSIVYVILIAKFKYNLLKARSKFEVKEEKNCLHYKKTAETLELIVDY